MYKFIIANLLRCLPNQAEKSTMVPKSEVEDKVDLFIETHVQDTSISCYYPSSNSDRLPVYVNFHGGAFIMNDKEMDDPYCRYLAHHAGCIVINVDYAKAPEHPFPKPVEQCYEVLQWIKKHARLLHGDPEKMIIGGQSSGANIAAALCLLLKEKQEPQPLLQVLSCPMLDFVTPHADKPETNPWRAKYPQAANFLNHCYVPEKEQAKHPMASPVCAENVEDLASALILIAEKDAFSREAERYAEKLREAGNHVQCTLFKDSPHAFTHIGPRQKAEEAWALIASSIKDAIRH